LLLGGHVGVSVGESTGITPVHQRCGGAGLVLA